MSSRFFPVEPLSATHVVTGFDCASPAQSVWLTEHGRQAHRAGLSRVYVVADTDHPDRRVVGYYALAAGSVARLMPLRDGGRVPAVTTRLS